MRGLFVTGTDTGVGKTVVSAALFHRYRGASPRLRYWKPVQTGIERDDDSATVARLGVRDAVLDVGVRLPRPLSPHLAAALSGVAIDVAKLVDMARSQPDADRFVVEGAGGVLVPLNARALMVDLMRALALPVLIVARSGLGTINHTLLALEALRARDLIVAGVMMVGRPDADNRAAIEAYGETMVVGELPMVAPLAAGTLAAAASAIDPDDRLKVWLA